MRWLAASAKTCAAVAALSALLTVPALATSSTIATIVCPTGQSSTVSVTSPVSDSTINQPQVQLKGVATRGTQIEVRLDDVYSSTIPLGILQQSFSVPLTLTAGTHDIKLTINDVCGVQDGVTHIVLTYQPQAVPSNGQSVTTSTIASAINGAAINSDTTKRFGVSVLPAESASLRYGSVAGLVADSAKPTTPVAPEPVIVAVPFVAGAGIFGWLIKWVRFR